MIKDISQESVKKKVKAHLSIHTYFKCRCLPWQSDLFPLYWCCAMFLHKMQWCKKRSMKRVFGEKYISSQPRWYCCTRNRTRDCYKYCWSQFRRNVSLKLLKPSDIKWLTLWEIFDPQCATSMRSVAWRTSPDSKKGCSPSTDDTLLLCLLLKVVIMTNIITYMLTLEGFLSHYAFNLITTISGNQDIDFSSLVPVQI